MGYVDFGRLEFKRTDIKDEILIVNFVIIDLMFIKHFFNIHTCHNFLINIKIIHNFLELFLINITLFFDIFIEKFFIKFIESFLDNQSELIIMSSLSS